MNATRRHRQTPRSRRLRATGLVAGAALALTLAGCGNSSSSTAAAEKGPITIGMSLPLTGPVADRAKPGYEGYQYWVDELNAGGGLLGRKVALKVLDDSFDPKTAIAGYNRLISQDKVDLVLGTFSSMLNLAVAPVAERSKYLYVEPSGGADEIFERSFKYLFFAQPATTRALPNQFVNLIKQMPPGQRPTTAAYVQQEDPNTVQAAKLFRSQLEALGVKPVYFETYPADAANFDSIANAIKRTNAQLVIHGAVGGDGVGMIRSFQKVDYSPSMLFQQNAPTDPAFPSAIKAANTEGILTPLAYSAQAPFPGNAEFVAGYTKKFGAAPAEDAANSYTAGQVLAAAVKAVGSLDQPKLAEWLHANTVQTIVGPLKWDNVGRPEGELLLGQWQSGKIEVIAPSQAATTKKVVMQKPGWQ